MKKIVLSVLLLAPSFASAHIIRYLGANENLFVAIYDDEQPISIGDEYHEICNRRKKSPKFVVVIGLRVKANKLDYYWVRKAECGAAPVDRGLIMPPQSHY